MHCSLSLSMTAFFPFPLTISLSFYLPLCTSTNFSTCFILFFFRSMQLHSFELTYQFFCVVFICMVRLNTVNDLLLLVCIYSIVLSVTINFIRSIWFRFWLDAFSYGFFSIHFLSIFFLLSNWIVIFIRLCCCWFHLVLFLHKFPSDAFADDDYIVLYRIGRVCVLISFSRGLDDKHLNCGEFIDFFFQINIKRMEHFLSFDVLFSLSSSFEIIGFLFWQKHIRLNDIHLIRICHLNNDSNDSGNSPASHLILGPKKVKQRGDLMFTSCLNVNWECEFPCFIKNSIRKRRKKWKRKWKKSADNMWWHWNINDSVVTDFMNFGKRFWCVCVGRYDKRFDHTMFRRNTRKKQTHRRGTNVFE